jgi:hypothetical protein
MYQEEFTKGVIRICKLKKYRQHNGQRKKDKRTWSKQLENEGIRALYGEGGSSFFLWNFYYLFWH